MKAEYSKKECKNCEYPMDSCHKFCTNCGQKDLEKKLSIKDFFEEFLANFYAFDSKVITSLRYLYTKPGVMAYEFVNGKRLKFVNPFRLLLSLAILLGLFMKLVTFVEEIKGDNLVKNKIEQEATDSVNVKLVSGLANIKVNIKKN